MWNKTKSKLKPNVSNLSWRDVLDLDKLDGRSYKECRLLAKSVGYKYIHYKGVIYHTLDVHREYPICSVNEIGK